MNNTIVKTKRLLVVCIVLVAASVLSLLFFWLYQRRNQPFDPIPIGDPLEQSDSFKILSMEEQNGIMTVTTSYGAFCYPTETSGEMKIQAGLDGELPTLRFTIMLDVGEIPLFTIQYGGEKGLPCGTYRYSADDEEMAVMVIFADAPEQLDSEDRVAFEMAQELFNEIIHSMEEDPRFVGLG